MPEIIIPQRFAQRRGTPAEWAAAPNVLYEGEIGFELDDSNRTVKWKIGDGVTPWAALPYAGDSFDLLAFYVDAPSASSVSLTDAVLVLQEGTLRTAPAGVLPGGGGDAPAVFMPMVNGDVPPTLIHDDLGNLIYSQVE